MKRKEDPKRTEALENRTRAQIWLDILRYGIAESLKRGYGYNEEDMPAILDFANDVLPKAVADIKAAEKAYEPYYAYRRRPGFHRNPKKKT
jgi:hypothetical protein